MLMKDRNKDDLPMLCAPVLDADLLARVHQLNRDYVELLIAEYHAGAGLLSSTLSPSTLATLAELTEPQRWSLAKTSHSLYSLSFENVTFWRSATAVQHEAAVTARYRCGPVDAAFFESALFLAWHVAVINPVAARVLYAMPGMIAARLAATPLWQLRRVAADGSALLRPRWPTNARFWPDLARFAACNDVRRLNAAQLVGHQLIAAELEKAHRAARRVSRSTDTPARMRTRARSSAGAP
jgi:hypothetical protein